MNRGDRGLHNGELRFSSNSQGCKILGGGHHVEWFNSNIASDMEPFEEMSNTEIIEGGTCQQ